MHACALGLKHSWLYSNGQVGITIFFSNVVHLRKSNCRKDGRAIIVTSAGLSWTVEDTVAMLDYFEIIKLLQSVIHHWKCLLLRYIMVSVAWQYVN